MPQLCHLDGQKEGVELCCKVFSCSLLPFAKGFNLSETARPAAASYRGHIQGRSTAKEKGEQLIVNVGRNLGPKE